MIAVWFSCGAPSAVAAKLTLDQHSDVRVINNPVAEEDEDNTRFLRDVESWLGVKIERAINSKYPSCSARDVWAQRAFMSGPLGAPCTTELKKRARQEWEQTNKADWHVLGFTVDERKRFDRFVATERSNVLPVLIDAGLTRQDCLNIIMEAGIAPPRIYSRGFPNANCIGCVKATSPTYWSLVRKEYPSVYADRAAQSRALGVRLARYKGQRLFLDELPSDAKGRPLKNMQIDCGIFCEEK